MSYTIHAEHKIKNTQKDTWEPTQVYYTYSNRDICVAAITEWQRKFGLKDFTIIEEYENETA